MSKLWTFSFNTRTFPWSLCIHEIFAISVIDLALARRRVHWNMSIETVLTGNVNLPRTEAPYKHVYRSFDPSDASVYDVRLYLWRARGVDDHAQQRTSP